MAMLGKSYDAEPIHIESVHAKLLASGFNLEDAMPMKECGGTRVAVYLDGTAVRWFKDMGHAMAASELLQIYWRPAWGRRVTVGPLLGAR